MNNLTQSIFDYLNTEKPQYALLLSGDWGAGKTYYYREILEKKVQEKYSDINIIYVSLYGLDSIEEIVKYMFLQLKPVNEIINKYGKLDINIFTKHLPLKQILYLSDIEEIVKKFTTTQIKEENIFICFDDLERRGNNLTINQFAGFVNSLLDNYLKVLVIANKNKIDNEDFIDLREKTFGNHIEFPKIFSLDLLNDLIIQNQGNEKDFLAWILKSFTIIEDLFSKKSQNLRILKIILAQCHRIYICLCADDRDFVFSKYNEIYDQILKFIISITIEFKAGEVSFENRRDLDKIPIISKTFEELINEKSVQNDASLREEDKNIEYIENFKNRYGFKNDFVFFESIYNYLTGYSLDEELFLKQITELREKKNDGHYIVYNKIVDDFFGIYDDDEYKKLLIEGLKYSYEGLYSKVGEYQAIYSFAIARSEIYKLEVNEEKILNSIKEILKSKSKKELSDEMYNLNLFYLSDKEIPSIPEKDKQFAKKIVALIFTEEESRFEAKIKNLNIETLITSVKEKEYIFKNISEAEAIFNLLKDTTNYDLYRLEDALNARYHDTNYKYNFFELEKDSRKHLVKLIEDYILKIPEDKINRIRNFKRVINALLD